MKSLRMFAAMMLALLLAFSTASGFGSAGFQHDPKKTCKDDSKKEKENKDESKKEKDSKKDKDKVDKAIDDLDKALDADKEKDSKKDKDKDESKKEKKDKVDKAIEDVDKALRGDKEKNPRKEKSDSGKDENYKPRADSDYEGTYSGRKGDYELELKLEKAKKGPLFDVKGEIIVEHSFLVGQKYKFSIQGNFYPRTGRLRGTYKPADKKAQGQGSVDGQYKDGSLTVNVGGVVSIEVEK